MKLQPMKITKKEQGDSTRADQIPEQLESQYKAAMREQGEFWGDMTELCMGLALRNVECRELTADHYDREAKELTLFDSKQVKSWMTKQVKAILQRDWILKARVYLHNQLKADNPQLSGMVLVTDDLGLIKTCSVVGGCETELEEMRLAFYESQRANAFNEALNSDKRPQGRKIKLNGMTNIIAIIEKRVAKYSELGGYLFPSCELQSNRAKGKGFTPVSRQTVYRVVERVRTAIRESGSLARKLLKGLLIGLHSARKSGVQKVAKAYGLERASKWVGHGSTAITRDYLDRTEQKEEQDAIEINALMVA